MGREGICSALTFAILLSACANQPCRTFRDPARANASSQPGQAPKKGAPTVVTPPTSSGGGSSPTGSTVPSTTSATILVFKPDGSLQCQAAKGLSPEEMEKQLDGIKVISRDKRPDGLMHIQVCGSPTGMINVFEIPASALKEAEGRGFKRLDRN